jgi:hypothetical protein
MLILNDIKKITCVEITASGFSLGSLVAAFGDFF